MGFNSDGKETEYWTVVENFITWYEDNYLHLNVTKIKELVMNLKRRKALVTPVSIQGVGVDVLGNYNYL